MTLREEDGAAAAAAIVQELAAVPQHVAALRQVCSQMLGSQIILWLRRQHAAASETCAVADRRLIRHAPATGVTACVPGAVKSRSVCALYHVTGCEAMPDKQKMAGLSRLTLLHSPQAALQQAHAVTLPNGWRVSHGSPAEASFIYREIFEERCYVQHGIRVHNGSICVDVGANVGAPPSLVYVTTWKRPSRTLA